MAHNPKKLQIRDFLFDQVNYASILRGFFDLNYLEFIVLSALHQNGESDVDTLMEFTANAWHRNKLNGALRKLVDEELCTRRSETTTSNGNSSKKYIYSLISTDDIKSRLLYKLDNWVEVVTDEINQLEYWLNSVDIRHHKKRKSTKDKVYQEWFGSNEKSS